LSATDWHFIRVMPHATPIIQSDPLDSNGPLVDYHRPGTDHLIPPAQWEQVVFDPKPSISATAGASTRGRWGVKLGAAEDADVWDKTKYRLIRDGAAGPWYLIATIARP